MVCYGNFRRGQLQSLTRDGCLQEALFKVIWLGKLWCSIWVVAFERWLHLEVSNVSRFIHLTQMVVSCWLLTAWIIKEFEIHASLTWVYFKCFFCPHRLVILLTASSFAPTALFTERSFPSSRGIPWRTVSTWFLCLLIIVSFFHLCNHNLLLLRSSKIWQEIWGWWDGQNYQQDCRLKGLSHTIAGLHVTSRRPCWWSRTKAFLSSGD